MKTTVAEQIYMCLFAFGIVGMAGLIDWAIWTEHVFIAAVCILAAIVYVVFGVTFGLDHDWSKR